MIIDSSLGWAHLTGFGPFLSKTTFMKPKILLAALLALLLSPKAQAAPAARFWVAGDGVLVLAGQTIRFRTEGGEYDEAGLRRINALFRADFSDPQERMSLRFIEVLDAVQDRLQGGSYSLKSGYRSPRLNNSLRSKGKLAAQSSMHMEAAAGDLILAGVDSAQVFDFVKSLDCCGIGYYHGRHFHLDTGPSRYWDETTSKTEDKTPQENEKIILQPDYDVYRPGDVAARRPCHRPVHGRQSRRRPAHLQEWENRNWGHDNQRFRGVIRNRNRIGGTSQTRRACPGAHLSDHGNRPAEGAVGAGDRHTFDLSVALFPDSRSRLVQLCRAFWRQVS